MGNAVSGAAREIWDLIVLAVTDPGPYMIALLVLVAAAGALMFRGKLASMVWMPALALAAYLAWRRFVP